MAYIGQPTPSTVININQVKISDGKSVDVTVAASNGINAGEFAVIDGFFGLALKTINAEENTAGEVIALQIEQAEYITDQIDTTKTFTKGAELYFDPATKKFTDDNKVTGAFLWAESLLQKTVIMLFSLFFIHRIQLLWQQVSNGGFDKC